MPFREWFPHSPDVAPLARDIEHLHASLTNELKHLEHRIMSALDDLKAALTDLVNEAVTDLEALIAKLAATPPDDTAAIQALTAQATDTTAKLKADMAAIATPPAP